MAELAGGARFPARLLKALHRANGDPIAVQRIGIHYATDAQTPGIIRQVSIFIRSTNPPRPAKSLSISGFAFESRMITPEGGSGDVSRLRGQMALGWSGTGGEEEAQHSAGSSAWFHRQFLG